MTRATRLSPVHRCRTALIALLALALLPACDRSVAKEHTSLSLSPGEDPGPPKTRLTMVWHHHSTGDDILKGGLLKAIQANNIDFFDINYKEGQVGDYVIGDQTDPPDLPKNFNTPKYFEVIKGWELDGKTKKQHNIVMFKSCFPASDIKDDGMLKKYKEYYRSMLPTFKANPDILFIAMSTPPLMKGNTTPENAARARQWAKWVTTEYAKDLKNVQVFDLFNALAILEGKADASTLVPQFGVAKYDSHPSPEGAKAVTRMFIPWFNRTLKQTGFGG